MKIMNGIFAKLCLCILTVMIWGHWGGDEAFATCSDTQFQPRLTIPTTSGNKNSCSGICASALAAIGYSGEQHAVWLDSGGGNCYCFSQLCLCTTGCPEGHPAWDHASTLGWCNRRNCCYHGEISSCTGADPWASCVAPYGTMYENRTAKTGDKTCGANQTATCVQRIEYQCARGFYGSPTSCTAGCTRCPSHANNPTVFGTTVNAGATVASGFCYINNATTMGDGATGSFIFNTNCYYS